MRHWPVACAGSDPISRDQCNSLRCRSNHYVSTALESSRQSPCAGQLWKEGPLLPKGRSPALHSVNSSCSKNTSITYSHPGVSHPRGKSDPLPIWRTWFLQPSDGSRCKKDDCKEIRWGSCTAHPEESAPPNPQLRQRLRPSWKAERSGSSSASCQRAPPGLRFDVPPHPIRQSNG